MFPIIKVPANASDQTENLGTKPKFWYRQPEGYSYLFKEARSGTGEDWSEKIACELCKLLGLPHAHYDLALWKDKNGIVTRNCCIANGTLIHGNEILHSLVENYPKGSDSDQKVFYRVSQHTLNRVLGIVEVGFIKSPLGWETPSEISSAIEVFVGYLMLDAWIGNTDRHHENWAIISYESELYLAPTFDHASSLGRNENDKRRQERMITKDKNYSVKAYVEKSDSAFYNEESNQKPMKTLEVFRKAAIRYPKAAKTWLSQLEHISVDEVNDLFRRIPPERISSIASEFALKMLEINKRRLMELRSELT